MSDQQPNESVVVDLNYAGVALSHTWACVKSAPASSKVSWFIAFIVIAVSKVLRRPVWSPLWPSSEFTWQPVGPDSVARGMNPKVEAIGSFLTQSGFHWVVDYTTRVLLDGVISRVFINTETNTYATLTFSKVQTKGKCSLLGFRTIYEGLHSVFTGDSRPSELPPYERCISHYYQDASPEVLLAKHLSHIQSPEVAEWNVLTDPSADAYFGYETEVTPVYFDFLESKGVARRRTKQLARVVGKPVIPRLCEWHPTTHAIATCTSCGKPVCVSCLKRRSRASYCIECAKAVGQSEITNYQPGGFLRRLCAFVIDGLAIIILWYALSMLVKPLPTNPAAAEAIGNARGVLGLIFFMLAPALYSILLTGALGATPGKLVAGIKVIADNGQPATYWDAGVRYVGYLLSFLTIGIGFLMPLWDPKKQALHDRFAETRVVHSKPLPIQDQPEEVTYGT